MNSIFQDRQHLFKNTHEQWKNWSVESGFNLIARETKCWMNCNCAQRLLFPDRTFWEDVSAFCVEISWVLPRRKTRVHRGFSRMVLWPEKRVTYFSGPKSCHQLMTFSTGIGPKRDPKTGPSFFNFFELFCFKISLFWTPHVISRRLGSNYTLASARPLLAGIV